MKTKFLHWSMLLAAVMSFSLSGCNEEEENNIGVKGNPESNTTDVAVTGKVSEVGAMYAKLGGVVNLDIISVSYTNVEIGIEVSTDEDFSSSRKFRSESVVGRSFSIKAAILQSDTKHYYRTYVNIPTISFDYLGETGTFTTASAKRDIAVTGEADSIGAFFVCISGSANLEDVREAGGYATVSIVWSKNADMSDSSDAGFVLLDSLGDFNIKINSLLPQTTYYYHTKTRVHPYFNYTDKICSFTTASLSDDLAVTGDTIEILPFRATLSGNVDIRELQVVKGSVSVLMELSKAPDFGEKQSVVVALDKNGMFELTFNGLCSQTTYYYRTVVNITAQDYTQTSWNKSIVGETRMFTTTYAYEDLGLPSGLKWATCNVGANNPEDYGDYFAWGEVEGYNSGKTQFVWSTYKYSEGSESNLTKYCNSSKYGIVDNLTELESADDAASVNWSKGWHTPTQAEWEELYNNCIWTWTTQNGVNGYEVVGKNGNSIFLPAAGRRSVTSLYSTGEYGYYWSCSLQSSNQLLACDLYFDSKNINTKGNYGRANGLSIRAVRK